MPSLVKKVCFIDYSIFGKDGKGLDVDLYNKAEKNFPFFGMFFYPIPPQVPAIEEIKYIDVRAMTRKQNPYCIKTNNGKINLVISTKFFMPIRPDLGIDGLVDVRREVDS